MKTIKKQKWFIKTRGSYLPKNWQGLSLYLIYLAYLIWVLVFVFISDYELWSAVFIVIPNWLAACVALSWIASKTSN